MYGLIEDETKLQSYLTNALPKLVRALKSQRGLGMWEIVNEPEGCLQPGRYEFLTYYYYPKKTKLLNYNAKVKLPSDCNVFDR